MFREFGLPNRARYETEWKVNGNAQKRRLELVESLKFPTEWLSDQVYLTDFGISLRADTNVDFKLQGVMDSCSPERFHGQNPSPASDMWSFGVIFVYLYTGWPPFEGCMSNTSMDCTSAMVDRLGPLPAEWKGHFIAEIQPDASWYDPRNKSLPDQSETFEQLMIDDRDQDREWLPHNKAEKPIKLKVEKHALAIIKKVFAYRPEHRPTASQLLQDPDFKELLQKCGV